MPTWKAYFEINGNDYSAYPVIEFPVSEDLYASITSAISENRPLRDCPFYDELVYLATENINLDKFLPDWLEKPDPYDYEDDEKFMEDWEGYGEQREDFLETLHIHACVIDDPGDLKRLEDRVRGLRLPSDTVTCEDEYCTRRYEVTVSLDDNGCITEVVDVQAEGLKSESANSSSWSSCYPDYKLIVESLQEECHRNEGASHA